MAEVGATGVNQNIFEATKGARVPELDAFDYTEYNKRVKEKRDTEKDRVKQLAGAYDNSLPTEQKGYIQSELDRITAGVKNGTIDVDSQDYASTMSKILGQTKTFKDSNDKNDARRVEAEKDPENWRSNKSNEKTGQVWSEGIQAGGKRVGEKLGTTYDGNKSFEEIMAETNEVYDDAYTPHMNVDEKVLNETADAAFEAQSDTIAKWRVENAKYGKGKQIEKQEVKDKMIGSVRGSWVSANKDAITQLWQDDPDPNKGSLSEFGKKMAESYIPESKFTEEIDEMDSTSEIDNRKADTDLKRLRGKKIAKEFEQATLAGEFVGDLTGDEAVVLAMQNSGYSPLTEDEIDDLDDDEKKVYDEQKTAALELREQYLDAKNVVPISSSKYDSSVDGKPVNLGVLAKNKDGSYTISYSTRDKGKTKVKGENDEGDATEDNYEFDAGEAKTKNVPESWVKNWARTNDVDEAKLMGTLDKDPESESEEELNFEIPEGMSDYSRDQIAAAAERDGMTVEEYIEAYENQ